MNLLMPSVLLIRRPGLAFPRVGLAALLAGVLTLLIAQSAETNGPNRFDFTSFRVIAEKNIFNASRSGRSPSARPRETRRETRVESFALVGTMSYEKGYFAFFDGTGSDYRKALPPGGLIGGFTIREITPKAVKLEAEGKLVVLPVNGQMRREDEGTWEQSERTETFASSGSGSRRDSESRLDSTPASSGPSVSSGELSEVLKRLMEQREKELK